MDRYDKATELAAIADNMQALVHDDQTVQATFLLIQIHSLATDIIDELVEESLE